MKQLQDIGERKLIQQIIEIIPTLNNTMGIGDDCAVIDFQDKYLLISTDMITQKTHIPSIMTPWDIGWFIAAINLSDLAAKAGTPLGFLLSMGLSKKMNVEDFHEIIKGVEHCLSTYNTSLIGGDTKEHESTVLNGTILGFVEKENYMPRFGAKKGDIIAVTGSLGKAAAGYIALDSESEEKEIIDGLIHPTPKINEGIKLGNTTKINCCMDLSDGLSSSLHQLKQLNNLGFQIYGEKLPISQQLKEITEHKQKPSLEYALHFGGDYELLFTCSPDDFQKIKDETSIKTLTQIGTIINERDVIITNEKGNFPLEDKGYQHFQPHFYDA